MSAFAKIFISEGCPSHHGVSYENIYCIEMKKVRYHMTVHIIAEVRSFGTKLLQGKLSKI